MTDRKVVPIQGAAGRTYTPRQPPFDGSGGGGDDGGMEARIRQLEQDVAVIKATHATRTDLEKAAGELRAAISDATATHLKWYFVTLISILVGGGVLRWIIS